MRRSILTVALLGLTISACTSMRVGSDFDHEASFASVTTYDWVATAEGDEDNAAAIDRINPFLDRRLRRAVDYELAERGLQKVEEGPVDLLVAVDVLDAQRVGEVRRATTSATPVFFSVGFGFNPGWYSPWGWGGYPFWGYSRFGWGGRYGWGRPWGWGSSGWGRASVGVGLGFGTPYFGVPAGGSFGVTQSWGGYGLNEPGLPPGSFVIDVLDGTTGELVWRGWAEGAVYYTPDPEDLPDFISSTVHRILEDFPAEVTRGGDRSAS